MRKAPIELQDLRPDIREGEAEPEWRFWGLFVHVCKLETLREAYALAKRNDGSPGIDGVTFEAIEAGGAIHRADTLVTGEYLPLTGDRRYRRTEGLLGIPQSGTGWCSRIADRRGVVWLSAHAAVRVAEAIVQDARGVDLSSYFDNIRHHLLLEKVARRVNDRDVLALLKKILKANGKKGVPQGGVISPLLSNVYLNEVDRMLERAKETTREGQYTYVEYVRWADDLVILVDAYQRHDWLLAAVDKRLREELETPTGSNERGQEPDGGRRRATVSDSWGSSFRVRSLRGVWRPQYSPQMKTRSALLRKLKKVFRRYRSQPVGRVVEIINPTCAGG